MPPIYWTCAPCILKIQWFPLSTLTFDQKSSFLGPTIFKIPQPVQAHLSQKVTFLSPSCYCLSYFVFITLPLIWARNTWLTVFFCQIYWHPWQQHNILWVYFLFLFFFYIIYSGCCCCCWKLHGGWCALLCFIIYPLLSDLTHTGRFSKSLTQLKIILFPKRIVEFIFSGHQRIEKKITQY